MYVYMSMEAGWNLLTSSPPIPPQPHIRNWPFSSSSVLVLHEQSAHSLPLIPSASLAQHFPTSALLKDQRDEGRLFSHIMKEDRTCQCEKTPSSLFGAEGDEFLSSSSASTSFSNFPLEEVKTVRSTRLLERRSKKRRVPMPKVMFQKTSDPPRKVWRRKKAFHPKDAFQLLVRGAENKRLLTAKEESEVIAQIQSMIRLEEVKSRLQSQLDRELTMVEWASAVGLSCWDLRWKLRCGNRSREKLIFSNFRLVVHIANHYEGRGIDLQDLLVEGSIGLIRSVEKFNPEAGCRFASYAYWWIREAITRSIFNNSRIIRLPAHLHMLLKKVTVAKKRLRFLEGNRQPTNFDIAARVGITVEKLERLLFWAREPSSLDRPWFDAATGEWHTGEDMFDPSVEDPYVVVAKEDTRQHVRNVLSILSPRDQTIIQLRFGFGGPEPKTLLEIGDVFGISKERVRQLESRALSKLKESLGSEELSDYGRLVV